MLKKILSVVVVMLVGFLAGCVHNPVPPQDTRVTLAPNLGSSAYVTSVRCAKNESGFFTFQANVVNNASSLNRVEYKVQWLDAQGFEIESVVSTWQNLALQPFEIRGLKATAPSPAAVDFRFYVRKMK